MSDSDVPQSTRQIESSDAAKMQTREVEPPIDPLREAQRLAASSRRRNNWLVVATVLAWIIACGAAIWTAEIYFNEIRRQLPFLEYRFAQLHEEIEGKPWHELTEDQRRESNAGHRTLGHLNELMMILAQGSIALFGIAALLSVWLTISSRRVALRQINANLLSITLELKKLLPEAVPFPPRAQDSPSR